MVRKDGEDRSTSRELLQLPGPTTPYQGSHRAMGKFHCECGNEWISGHSWANTHQTCQGCEAEVYPIHQWKLKRGTKKANSKAHDQVRCGKCKEIGGNCVNLKKKAYKCPKCGNEWANNSKKTIQKCYKCSHPSCHPVTVGTRRYPAHIP
ncbi:zinc finger CCHC domain-containing protein 24-like [Antedon mediterranea]|uniref:zinc finger CCHC domain-containing protein 24-like n=1 Tax=Antedon mediterranea TaxID=105859 RepID=UPI003AF9E5E9